MKTVGVYNPFIPAVTPDQPVCATLFRATVFVLTYPASCSFKCEQFSKPLTSAVDKLQGYTFLPVNQFLPV